MSTERTDFTPDEIVHGIAVAIERLDFGVIPGLVKYLATKDPHRAQKVLDALNGRITVDVRAAWVRDGAQ